MDDEAAIKAEGEKYIPRDYDRDLYRIRHSTAHVMAQAVLERFPKAKIAIGPPVEHGFYYDFDIEEPLTDDDLKAIEKRMRQIVAGKHPFHAREVSADEARQLFRDQPYKLELIQALSEGKGDENGGLPAGATAGPAPDSAGPGPASRLTVYQQDTFTDLCRGPHVENTGKIAADGFKLLNVTGAYWRGDEHNKMLKRIYGTAWRSRAELEDHLNRLEEAKRRDHRKIGKELELFTHNALVGAGFPMWLPKGATIRRLLEEYIQAEERKAGYLHVYTPSIAKQQLYEVSGHWEHYKDNMFPPMELEHEKLVLRPMNCPHHILIYASKQRSYRELPVRIGEMGTMYRFEKSGVVSGLSRVRCMCLNDAHLFCRPDQIKGEFAGVMRLIEKTYAMLGIKDYSYRLSLRDPKDTQKYVQNDAMWEMGERVLREALTELGLPFREAPGEAAFYGPKVDVQLRDVLGHEETVSTIQVDFHLPNQFNLGYIDQNDKEVRPVILHRAIISTLERMVAYLIELYVGAFPAWLAPVQVVMVPITERHVEYARQVARRLEAGGYRVEVNEGDRRMNAKIREAQLQKVPYIVVVGDEETTGQTVSVRLRTGENLPRMTIDAFEQLLGRVVSERKLGLTE